jgi:hypothetical protein
VSRFSGRVERNHGRLQATYVAAVPKGERVLAMLGLGGEVYVYTERAAYRVDMDRGMLIDQAKEARER